MYFDLLPFRVAVAKPDAAYVLVAGCCCEELRTGMMTFFE